MVSIFRTLDPDKRAVTGWVALVRRRRGEAQFSDFCPWPCADYQLQTICNLTEPRIGPNTARYILESGAVLQTRLGSVFQLRKEKGSHYAH